MEKEIVVDQLTNEERLVDCLIEEEMVEVVEDGDPSTSWVALLHQ